ncbi:trans-sulfuration enzyme family protein [Spirosoma utsteinense]|uniref:Cystathionine gamma-synthase n=1 Tax=Spirosoma utsteinense TaxID=2585773 RepID=A0ABR6W5Q0_9BACT|nr:aminotransferase class V-fold PLP-dependent enzyme [Spirosoma utsteinense]MBC3786289.1 cystathionine gamma-synthase [Spirosoma utsteinense]MBC3791915.1 cystathionine gamma-synthase [Spirosoma utsteinense]
MHFDTLALHATHQPESTTGAVIPPIYLSTTFERNEANELTGDFTYTRPNNPTREALEHALAALEGGAVGMAFGSGQAATMTLFQALRPGDHVLLSTDAYYGTPALLEQVFHPWGLTYTRVDMTDLNAVESSIHENTRVVWCETPSNPMLAITDLLSVSRLAHEAGAICVCDNTWATPVLQRPFDLNCDVVMHSTTKYISGHSDVLGGALIFKRNDALAERVRTLQGLSGAVPSPFDCWLISRGIKTLGVRLRSQMATAQLVADYLVDHPAVEHVHFPGLPNHPDRALIQQQMNGPGAMLSIQVKGGAAEAIQFIGKLKLFTRATSLGGVESLIEHRASVEGPTSTTPVNLLRVSIGLEHAEDLITDLAQALA